MQLWIQFWIPCTISLLICILRYFSLVREEVEHDFGLIFYLVNGFQVTIVIAVYFVQLAVKFDLLEFGRSMRARISVCSKMRSFRL